MPSGVYIGINNVLEMCDEDKSKLRDKGILKAVANIIDIIAHKLLGMAVMGTARNRQVAGRDSRWDQERDVLVQSEFLRQRNSRHFDDSLSGKCCKRGVSLYTYISKLTGKPTDKSMMLVSSFNVISGGSHAGNYDHRH